MSTSYKKIIRSHRTTISLTVTQTGDLIVHAPAYMPLPLIKQFIRQKQDWVRKNLEKAQTHHKIHKQFTHGETFYYLGKPYLLDIGNHKEIRITNILEFPRFLEFRIEKELINWYINQAREIMTQRTTHHAKNMQTSYTSIMFSDTKSKWGTCSHNNVLQFNWRLIMAPLMVLDYVIIHELVHTQEKNHGPSFWRKVRTYTPAYRQHRKWLENNAHLLNI